MENTIIERNGVVNTIEGRTCTYDTDEIRDEIVSFSLSNSKFNLPDKYTWVVTKQNGFAKIILKDKGKRLMKEAFVGLGNVLSTLKQIEGTDLKIDFLADSSRQILREIENELDTLNL